MTVQTKLFWTALLIHVVFWTFAPPLFLHNYQIDTMEMLIIGQHWVVASLKHPAFQGWVVELYSLIFNRAEFVPYLAAQTACALCVITLWRFASKILSPPLAILAALSLLSYFYFHYDSTVYNNRTFMRLFYLLAIYFLYLSFTENKTRYWILTGLALGLGIYCKLTIGVLILAILIYMVIEPNARKFWKTPRPYFSIAVCFLAAIPLLLWFYHTDFAMFHYAEKSVGKATPAFLDHLWSPCRFLLTQIPIVAVMLLPLYPILTRAASSLAATSQGYVQLAARRPTGRFLAGFLLIPLLLQLFAAGYFAGNMRTALGCHLWLILPLCLLYFTDTRCPLPAARCSLCMKIVFANIVVFAAGTVLITQLSPLFIGRDTRYHFPGKELAQTVNDIWTQRYDTPLPFIRGEDMLCEPIGCYLKPAPNLYSPLWSNENEFRSRGGILLWFIGQEGQLPKRRFKDSFGNADFCYNRETGVPSDWLAKFPDAKILPPLELQPHTIIPVPIIKIGIAIVPPRIPSAAKRTDEMLRRPVSSIH